MSRAFWTSACLAASWAAILAVPPAVADTVRRTDGGAIVGEVLSLDGSWVVVRTSRGNERVPRSEVTSIEFGPAEPPPPPVKIEIRNVRSDDAVDVFLNDEEVIREATEGGAWIDVSSRLKEGNNALRLRIRNGRGGWAYRIAVKINGATKVLECGTPNRNDDPCRCCGKTGLERGLIEDLPPVWVHVDRGIGRAEILP